MKCAVCQERDVSAGKTTGAARDLGLCLQCWGHQKVRRDRAVALGVKLRAAPRSRVESNISRAPARQPEPNAPPGYQSFEDLVRAIVRDELRAIVEGLNDHR